jgi:hypothetical protein
MSVGSSFVRIALLVPTALVAAACSVGGGADGGIDSGAKSGTVSSGTRGSSTEAAPVITGLTTLVWNADRWAGRRVTVVGELYKFPGNRISSERVQDQLICNRINSTPPDGTSLCIFFWGLRIQDVPGVGRSPDGGLWVKDRIQLDGTLRGYPHRPYERVVLRVTDWRVL